MSLLPKTMCKSLTSQRRTRKCRDFRTGLVCAGQRSGSAVKEGGSERERERIAGPDKGKKTVAAAAQSK